MSDNPPDWRDESSESTDDSSPEADRSFRKYNPNWEQEVFGNTGSSSYQSEWQTRQAEWQYEGPRPWHRIFRDFLTMGDERDCAYLLYEPTADASHGIGWYVAVSGTILAIAIVFMMIVFAFAPNDLFEDAATQNTTSSYRTNTSPYATNNRTTTTTFSKGTTLAFYCIGGPIGIGLNVLVYSVVLMIVHVIATGVFGGEGEYDKLVYGAFTLFTAMQTAQVLVGLLVVPIVIVLVLIMPSALLPLYCLFLIVALLVGLYVYYLYTMVVKTVYQLGWFEAFMSAIGIPLGGTIVLYCSCAFCLAGAGGGGG